MLNYYYREAGVMRSFSMWAKFFGSTRTAIQPA
jgi:hypothetical protein